MPLSNRSQSFHAFFLVTVVSVLGVSLLDVIKQTHDTEIMFGVCIEIIILLSLPLSFFETIRVLRVLIGEDGGASLPQHIRNGSYSRHGRPELDFVALVGFAPTWLMFSRLLCVIFDHSTFKLTIPIPLLFVFFHGPTAILGSLWFTIVIYGKCLQTCGIGRDDWGPLKKLMRGARCIIAGFIALLEGQIGFSVAENARVREA
ncbi:hypothetical protein C8R42DRAFT_656056 [Lentinula raphanica]|nr:hypothetical protein C8R42DRAFT_656056 [Lentinula raphanica]